MPKYKITASKSQKKYTFVLNAENERLAKERIHDEGYSILSVELFDEDNIQKKIFLFKAKNSKWELKSWKVAWNDIFKIYLKLKDGLGYDILELYPQDDIERDYNYKKNLLKDLEEQYDFYKKKINSKKLKNKKQEIKEGSIDSFYLKKELEETYKLIDFVLEKTKKLFESKKINLEQDKREKLKKLYNSLVKIKSSTNIHKLRFVWEKVLLKIWEIEFEFLNKNKDKEIEEYLKETNKLLKQIWSNKKFTKKSDITIFIKNFFKESRKFFINEDKKVNKKINIWYNRLKTQLLLDKYKEKLKENTVDILKNFYLFIPFIKKFKEKRDRFLIEREVINQNISIFRAKLDKNSFSYIKTKKWIKYFFDFIFWFFLIIRNYLFFVVLFYSLLFLIFINLNYFWFLNLENSLNYRWIYYFIVFIFIYFAIYFSRWVFSLVINFCLLFFIFYFWIINF